MRQTLRRSCAACAKAKHSCDLGTPRCSRCLKRNAQCVYANEPSTSPPAAPGRDGGGFVRPPGGSGALAAYRFGSLDPFDSYPQTRLPRQHVQRLIHSFLHKIAFQYYPLDMNATSNPFLVSWWPLALGDPALFHVSLQTASLDEELIAQKGFQTSEVLMADSVALLRRKVDHVPLAVQDGTMNSVITLAAIEFGKGNLKASEMHVHGVRRLVNMRGGINSVRQTSPLTARMISWVSMLVMGHPQFETQNDLGIGDGIPPIPEWQLDSATLDADFSALGIADIDPEVRNVFVRLRHVFRRAKMIPLPATRLHDLTCFVVHRLLLSADHSVSLGSTSITDCLRYAMVLYMIIVHGPTYYSHAVFVDTLVVRFTRHLDQMHSASRFYELNQVAGALEAATTTPHVYGSLDIWLLTIGMVATTGTIHYQSCFERAREIALSQELETWCDVLARIKCILWLEMNHSEEIFRPHWDAILNFTNDTTMPSFTVCVRSSSDGSDLNEL
ncbi:hypothetical protein G7046_g439 [Stylonectria norvegica]|nr:hypothetical protein G7046_g439 [Stylonectria norvegica]